MSVGVVMDRRRVTVDHGPIGELGRLAEEVDDIDAESIDAPVEPEPQRVVHRRHDLGVAPVQVGLLAKKVVEVPLPASSRPTSTPGRR